MGINGVGAGTWVERALLTEAKGGVRAVEWAPKEFGMKIVHKAMHEHSTSSQLLFL